MGDFKSLLGFTCHAMFAMNGKYLSTLDKLIYFFSIYCIWHWTFIHKNCPDYLDECWLMPPWKIKTWQTALNLQGLVALNGPLWYVYDIRRGRRHHFTTNGKASCLHYDHGITWESFRSYWPFVWGIHWWPVDSPTQRTSNMGVDIFFYAKLKRWLNKQSRSQWFKMSWSSCDVTVM